MFAVGDADDGPIYGAGIPEPDAVDIGFTDIWIKDPLQYHVRGPHYMAE